MKLRGGPAGSLVLIWKRCFQKEQSHSAVGGVGEASGARALFAVAWPPIFILAPAHVAPPLILKLVADQQLVDIEHTEQ